MLSPVCNVDPGNAHRTARHEHSLSCMQVLICGPPTAPHPHLPRGEAVHQPGAAGSGHLCARGGLRQRARHVNSSWGHGGREGCMQAAVVVCSGIQIKDALPHENRTRHACGCMCRCVYVAYRHPLPCLCVLLLTVITPLGPCCSPPGSTHLFLPTSDSHTHPPPMPTPAPSAGGVPRFKRAVPARLAAHEQHQEHDRPLARGGGRGGGHRLHQGHRDGWVVAAVWAPLLSKGACVWLAWWGLLPPLRLQGQVACCAQSRRPCQGHEEGWWLVLVAFLTQTNPYKSLAASMANMFLPQGHRGPKPPIPSTGGGGTMPSVAWQGHMLATRAQMGGLALLTSGFVHNGPYQSTTQLPYHCPQTPRAHLPRPSYAPHRLAAPLDQLGKPRGGRGLATGVRQGHAGAPGELRR